MFLSLQAVWLTSLHSLSLKISRVRTRIIFYIIKTEPNHSHSESVSVSWLILEVLVFVFVECSAGVPWPPWHFTLSLTEPRLSLVSEEVAQSGRLRGTVGHLTLLTNTDIDIQILRYWGAEVSLPSWVLWFGPEGRAGHYTTRVLIWYLTHRELGGAPVLSWSSARCYVIYIVIQCRHPCLIIHPVFVIVIT